MVYAMAGSGTELDWVGLALTLSMLALSYSNA